MLILSFFLFLPLFFVISFGFYQQLSFWIMNQRHMLLDKSSKIYIAHLYSYIAYSQAICYVGPVRSEI